MSIIKILDTDRYLKQFNSQPKSLRLTTDCLVINDKYYAEYYDRVNVTAVVDPEKSLPKAGISWEYDTDDSGLIRDVEFSNYNSEMSFMVDSIGGYLDISTKTNNDKQDTITLNFIGVQVTSIDDIGIDAPSNTTVGSDNDLLSIKTPKDSTIYNSRYTYLYNGITYDIPVGEDDNIVTSPGGTMEDHENTLYIWEHTYVTFKQPGTYVFKFSCENIKGESFEVSTEILVQESSSKITSISCPEGGYSFKSIGETHTFNLEVEYENPDADILETWSIEHEDSEGVWEFVSSTSNSITVKCIGEGSSEIRISSESYSASCNITTECFIAKISTISVQPSSFNFNQLNDELTIIVTPEYEDVAPVTGYTGYEAWTFDLPGSGSVYEYVNKTSDSLTIKCIGEGSATIDFYPESSYGKLLASTSVSYIPSDVEEESNCTFTVCVPGLYNYLTNGSPITGYSLEINGSPASFDTLIRGDDIVEEESYLTYSELSNRVNTSYTATLTVNYDDDYNNSETFQGSAQGYYVDEISGRVDINLGFSS